MKIKETLVWDKHNSELIGYVDLGDIDLNDVALSKVISYTGFLISDYCRSF